MKRIESGKYQVEIKGDVFEVVRHVSRVETGRSDKGTVLQTWTPTKNGDQNPFGGRSYDLYREAKEAVYAHIEANYPDM